MPIDEEPLTGGNVADSVVRVGDTVRKPATAATPGIDALLEHLRAKGFTAAPRSFGLDDHGRHSLEFVPGEMADRMPQMDSTELRRLGGIVRQLHDACASFAPPADTVWDVPIPPDRDELICHHDLAPWNLVRDGDRWVFIDWDCAGPGSRLWDLGYTAHGFVTQPLRDPRDEAPRLRALADGYGLDDRQRETLPRFMIEHVRAMYRLLFDGARTGTQPWARLYSEGHGDYWRQATEYLERHEKLWGTALCD